MKYDSVELHSINSPPDMNMNHYCTGKISKMLLFRSYFSIHTICFNIKFQKTY